MIKKAVAALVFAVATMLSFAPQANAVDLTAKAWKYVYAYGNVICIYWLDPNPTVPGLLQATEDVERDGFSTYEAAGIMIASIDMYCPRHDWLVESVTGASRQLI